MNKQETRMTEGCIWKILVRFALPLFIGKLFQQLYNVVDSLVVGNFCGDKALAAVSSSGSLCFLLIGFFEGVFVGASVIISHRYGAKDEKGVDRAIHTTLWFSIVAGIILTLFGILFTPKILRLMGTPGNILPQSVDYFRIYCMGLLSLTIYNTMNGIYQALGDSKRPLYYLMLASVVNVVLDLMFVGVFRWGVKGAAFATIIGQTFSVILGMRHLMSGKFIVQINWRHIVPDFQILKQVLSYGIPSGVQNSVIAVGNVVVQSNINAFGELAMAGCGSHSKIQGFVFLPIMSITMALTTFVGQNLGAGNKSRVKKGAVQGIFMSVVMAELFGVFVYMCSPQLLGIFTKDSVVIAYGTGQARTEALFYALLAFSHAAAAVLRGAGKAMIPMAVMLIDWCFIRIAFITIVVRYIPNIKVVFVAYPITWTISTILFILFLWKGNWLGKKSL